MPDFVRRPSPIPIAALAVLLALPAAAPLPSGAAEAPPNASMPVPGGPAPPEPGDTGTERDGGRGKPPDGLLERGAAGAMEALEDAHAFVEKSILERVIRFDAFFGDVRTEGLRRPAYLLRWRNSVRWEEEGRFRYRTSVRANLRLPAISERLRLLIAGENEPEPGAGLPEDPGSPGFDRVLQDTRIVNTELRYAFLRRPASEIFLGAGIRVRVPVEAFVRARLQHAHRIGERFLARFAETLFWKDTEGLGETTEIDLERPLGAKTLVRWANAGTLAKASEGLEWGTELSLIRQLSPKAAVTLAAGAFGDTRPVEKVNAYRVLARYRRSFLRPWLFFEVEPEVSWPRSPEGSYEPAYAFTYRLEFLFQGTGDGGGTGKTGSP